MREAVNMLLRLVKDFSLYYGVSSTFAVCRYCTARKVFPKMILSLAFEYD